MALILAVWVVTPALRLLKIAGRYNLWPQALIGLKVESMVADNA